MRNDALLVAAVLAGSEGAFERLVESYQKLVWQIVFRMVQDVEATEDLCQEVFLRTHLKLKSFRFECSLSTWIGRIAFHRTCRYLQKQKKAKLITFEGSLQEMESETDGEDLEAQLIRSDLHKLLQRLLTKLPPLQQTLMSLYYAEELSITEIAGICDLPSGTIKSYLSRARHQIRKDLQLGRKEPL